MFQPVCSHRIRVNVPRTEHADEEHITYDTVLYEGLGDPRPGISSGQDPPASWDREQDGALSGGWEDTAYLR